MLRNPVFRLFATLLMLAIILAVIILVGYSQIEKTLNRKELYIDTDVSVCFNPGPGINPDQVSLHLAHTYPSSCSDFLDRTGTVHVDQNQRIIQIHSRFEVEVAPPGQMCTADSVSTNTQLNLPKMNSGIYQVSLSSEILGSIEFPLYSSVCFPWLEPGQQRPTFTPTPTSYDPYPERRSTVYPPPVIWTQTPEPYPYPSQP